MAAQIAASIEFEPTLRPAGAPDEMQPLAGSRLDFLSIKAVDGLTTTGALWQPADKPPAQTTLLVQVHGSGGNLASHPLLTVARALSPRGYALLTVNTRQHDAHVNTDNFFDVRRDIEAAVTIGKMLGHKSIVLQGHSLGTVQVAFYAATDWDPAIKAVILMAPFARLPWKSRHVLIQNEDDYGALARASRAAVQAGRVADPLPVEMRWLWGRRMPVTAQHFLTYRDEQASAADSTYWVPRIPHPILLLRDEADGGILPFEPFMLLSAARAEGSLVPSIRYVPLANTRPPSRDGHLFADNGQALIDAVLAWLVEQGL